MPSKTLNGCTIHYNERGNGPTVVITPGGRWGAYVQEVVASILSTDFHVITWDRRNTDGLSSIKIEGDVSEADIWSDDLAALIRSLNIGPCYLAEYAGCRTSPLVCFKYPELVKGLLLAWTSGGAYPAARLPTNIYQPYTRAALRYGMQEVVKISHFGRSVEQNPANRDALLAMDPIAFVKQMGFWEAFFTTSGDLPIAGCRLTEAEWKCLEIPTLITGGVDPTHPTQAAQRLHSLISNSHYHDPVVTESEWNEIFGRGHYPTTSDWQGERIGPVWKKFLIELESGTLSARSSAVAAARR
jgi:pimeloyl-ACP methyl ester carboxylesterase